MNLFQYITLPITLVLLIRSLVRFLSGKQANRINLLGAIIWLTASIAILKPELTMQAARFLGIGRGADLVLYLLVISFLVSFFYISQRFQRMESNITEIIRLLAIRDAAETKITDEGMLQENPDIQHS